MIKPVALSVHPDEPAWGLIEAPTQVPQPDGSIQSRWVQHIRVVRGNDLAYYTQDFGPAEDFEDVTPLIMPSIGTDTVAQLQEHAEKNRHDNYWAKRRKEMLEGSTLIEDAVRSLDQEREMILNRTHLGPSLSVQRNDVPRGAIREARKARIHDARRKG